MDNGASPHLINASGFNRRKMTVFLAAAAAAILLVIMLAGAAMPESAYAHSYADKRLAPSFTHPFGTDHMGRDMFARTIKGLSTSIWIGALAATFSAVIALALGMASAVFGGIVDKIILIAVDVFMGIPHLVLLMLISIAAGRGLKGVVIGVMLTHWPNLTRIIRAEVMEIRITHYVKAAAKFGVSPIRIMGRHILPHVLPQFLTGLILLFPHAILHEASITFLGFGLALDMPAIGIILSEAMNHLITGMWWLVLFPGGALLGIVLLFETLGDSVKTLLNPRLAQE